MNARSLERMPVLIRSGGLSKLELAIVVVWWTLYAAFGTGQALLYSAASGAPVSLGDAAARAYLGAFVWALITLVTFWLAHRFPFDRRPWTLPVAVHVIAGCALAFFEVAVTSSVNAVVNWFPGYTFAQLFFQGFPSNIIYYWLLLGVGHGLEYYRRYRSREQQSARLQARLARAELHLLKSQLQPHFLFNTLHAISALMHRDVKAADRMLARLSELLRVALDHSGTDEVPLREELAFLEPYVEIEKTRLGERLNVHLDIDPAALDAYVPHMILQPLVENAIRHGVAPRARPGLVNVRARAANGRIELVVEDDGRGRQDDSLRRGTGLGLANTRARLEQLYNDEFTFDAGDAPEGGFRVALSFPLQSDQPEPALQEAMTP